ncbi:hypothetical protein BH11PSE12_BH11PSE12_21490 [soil metagenome]
MNINLHLSIRAITLKFFICITLLLTTTAFASVDLAWSTPITDESLFFSQFSKPVPITNLYSKGDGSHSDAWIIRSSHPDFGFWEAVHYGTPYPLEIVVNSPDNYRLSILEPQSTSPVPFAVYTDIGFFGFAPTSQDDKFFQTSAKKIFSIYSVSPISEPSIFAIFALGLCIILFLSISRRRN